ncbi:MAG: CoA transferase [Pseudomonadota bacterium]|nr:CoA transferase [Pseudomonadota bacterium]
MSLHKADYDTTARGPLAGVRVLDLSRLVAGNTLTQVLADFGAEVIKVEPPAGDTLRAWKTQDVATHWRLYARNKKSLALDFGDATARNLLLELVASAQIFVESFRPDTLEKMDLGPDRLLEKNPRLVIVRISGFGQTGPYRRRPGFGTVVEGISGFASLNGFADREPVLPPIYLADTVAGLYGATGVLIALREVEMSGGAGQVIDLPLLDPLFTVSGPQAANYRLTGNVRPRSGSRSLNSGPRNVYPCKDGLHVCLSASTQKMAERVLRAIGHPELIDDPRFRTNADRVRHAAELDALVGEFIAHRTQAENVAFFDRAEVTVGPIYDIRQILEDPHFVERELLVDLPDPQMGEFPMHNVVPRLMRTPGSIRSMAPRLGEHNKALLAEVGVDDAAYRKLLEQGTLVEDDVVEADQD